MTTVVPATSPPDTKITSTKVRRAKHKATFAFRAIGDATGFQCKLQKAHHSAAYKSCPSPKTYKHLTNGRYKFFVRAIGPGGTDSTPATYRFKI